MEMERYRSYMDRVTVSDRLHERLRALSGDASAQKKRPWRPRAAALAACAVLAVGAGVCGLAALLRSPPPAALQGAASSAEITSEPAIDLAPAGPDDIVPGQKTLGGYETRETRAGVDVAVYHILPWIDYGAGLTAAANADWDFPPDTVRLELTAERAEALFGGADVLETHLGWGAYTLSGDAVWEPDGTFFGAFVTGHADALDHWECTVWRGALPPACIRLEGSVEQTVWNVAVTAEKLDTDAGAYRAVSFLANDGCGYRFAVTAPDAARAEELASRFVRQVLVDGGVQPANLTMEGDIHMPPAQDAAPPADTSGTSGAAASVPPQGAGE